jgi:hypothetical protein
VPWSVEAHTGANLAKQTPETPESVAKMQHLPAFPKNSCKGLAHAQNKRGFFGQTVLQLRYLFSVGLENFQSSGCYPHILQEKKMLSTELLTIVMRGAIRVIAEIVIWFATRNLR